MSMKKLIIEIRRYVAEHYPDDEPDMISIRLKRNGNSIRLPIPRKSFAEKNAGLRENEMLVLGHIPRHSGHSESGITIKALLKLTGYRDRGTLYKILRQLKLKGFIEQDDAKGFRRTK